MVVLPQNVEFHLSGGSNNANPFASLGGAISSNQVKDDALDSLLDQISITEQQSGTTDYYCFYIKNASSTSQITGCKIWFTVVTSFITMALGSSVVGGTEQTIADDETPPASVTFSQPLNYDNGLEIGNIPAGSWKAIWLKRIIPPNTPPSASVLTRIRIEGLNA